MRIELGIGLLGLTLAVGGCATSGPVSTVVGSQTASSASTQVSTPSAGVTGTPSVIGTPTPTHAPSPTASEVTMQSLTPFTLTSTAFRDGSAIPRRSTCDGEDTSPDLEWSGAPDGTEAFALVVRDPDARDFLHWLAFDIPGAADGRLPAAVAASATVPRQGLNDFGKRGYGGPCPPSGEHRYRFTLYALDRTLGIGGTPRVNEIEAAMKGHVLAQATVTGTYRRR